MKNLIPAARAFFCIGVIGMSLQQFYYGEFRPALILQLPAWIPFSAWFADLAGAWMIFLSVFILLYKNGKSNALLLAAFYMILFAAFQVPYMLFKYSDPSILGAYTNPLKTFALSGGAFVIAGSFLGKHETPTVMQRILDPLIPYGKIFFSIMLIVLGSIIFSTLILLPV